MSDYRIPTPDQLGMQPPQPTPDQLGMQAPRQSEPSLWDAIRQAIIGGRGTEVATALGSQQPTPDQLGMRPPVQMAPSMTGQYASPFSIGGVPDWSQAGALPQAPQRAPQADIPARGARPAMGQAPQAPAPQARPQRAPAPQAPASQGFESYTYLDENGRNVYGTRRVGQDHENGYGFANANSGRPWKGLLDR